MNQKLIKKKSNFKSILLLVLTTMALPIWSKPIDENTARKVAVQTLSRSSALRSSINAEKQGKTLKLLYKNSNNSKNDNATMRVAQANTDETVYFYVFGTENNVGFVIVSGDDRVTPVLGYSHTNSFSAENMPDNMVWWLDEYAQQIEYAIENDIEPTTETEQQWVQIMENGKFASSTTTSVSPLLTTTWNQMPYYNQLCPDNTPTGCGATAMAQIMKYHNHPVHGTGSHSYNHSTYGTLSADFGATTYQWANMPDALTWNSSEEQITAVATLMYHCGVATNTNYQIGGSGSSNYSVGQSALINYFGYENSMITQERYNYDADWDAMLRTDLDAGRPIFYGGSGAEKGSGHAFVCDGYDTGGFFHFNWGWGGMYDGWYQTTALTPSSYNFFTGQYVILHITPRSDTWQIGYPNPEDIIANFNNGTLTISGTGAMQNFDSSPWTGLDIITSVVINNGITTIGSNAFNNRRNLASVTISNSVESIGEAAFYNTGLTTITIPNSVTSIESSAFMGCSGLRSATIPNSVTVIKEYAFRGCNGLTDIYVSWVMPPSIHYVFYNINVGNIKLHIPQNILSVYQNATVWKNFILVNDMPAVSDFALSIETSIGGSISANKITAIAGETVTLTVLPDEGYELDVISAYKTGDQTTTITLSGSGNTRTFAMPEYGVTVAATFKKTVTPVSNLSLNKTVATLEINKTEQLTATVSPENASNKNVSWSSSNTSVAEVSQTGLVTAKSAGTATITVTTEDGKFTANCEITVIVPVSGISLNKTATTLVTGETEQLTATVSPENATNKNITWQSSNTVVAEVSKTGLVTAKSAGTATITATTEDGGKMATCAVTVTAAAVTYTFIASAGTGGTINPNGNVTVKAGGILFFTATPDPGKMVESWILNGYLVATSGNVYSVDNIQANGTIQVTFKDVPSVWVTSVSLNKSAITLKIGDTETLVAIVDPSTATNKAISWTSSNNDIATVEADGKVTAVAAGAATITATTEDGGFTADCEVTVQPNTVGIAYVTDDSISLYLKDDKLFVNSPVSEAVNIYSAGGILIYSGNKQAGETLFTLRHISNQVLIVKGSSGWMRKIVLNRSPRSR